MKTEAERLRELRAHLYRMLEGPLGDAWVNDDDEQFAGSFEELEGLALQSLDASRDAVKACRKFLAILRREQRKAGAQTTSPRRTDQ